MSINYPKNINLFSILFSFLPLIFLIGVAFNNIYSVSLAIYGIYLFFFIKHNQNYTRTIYFNFFLVFIILLIISSILSEFRIDSLLTSVPYSLYYFYFVASIYIIHKWVDRNFNYFILSFYISVVLLFFFSIFEYFTLVKNDQGELEYLYRKEGLKSLFGNKILGIYLIIIFPLFIGMKIFIKQKFKFYDFIIIFMILSMLLFSYHRTSILLFLLFIFLVFIIIAELRKIISIIAVLTTFSFFISLNFFNDFSSSVISKTKNQIFNDTSINFYPDHYLGHYQTSLKMIKKNFIFGTGPNTFKNLCSNKNYETIYDEFLEKGVLVKLNSCSTHTHNFYLQLFSESGVFVFLLIIFFYVFILRELILCFLGKNNLQNNQFYKICLISTFCNFLPIAPSVDFFNTYLNTLLYLPCIFILYFKLKSNNLFTS